VDEPETRSCSTCGSWWQLPLLLALVLAALFLTRRESSESTPSEADRPASGAVAPSGETVSLAVDLGADRRDLGEVPWVEGMTVRDALASTGDANERVKFVLQGRGQSAFLTEIDGVKNEGAGGRNWTYAVNDQFADRSFAVYELRPGDRVLWTFANDK
jgi:hypothetical protein